MRRAPLLLMMSVGLAASAQAQDVRPALTELRRDGAVVTDACPGGYVGAYGHDLHVCPTPPVAPGERPYVCPHDGVIVRIAGKVAKITEASADHVQVWVPQDAPLGATRLELEVAGRSVGSLPLRIVRPEEIPPPPETPPPVIEGFEVTRFDLARDATGQRLIVGGRFTERALEGATLIVGVSYGGPGAADAEQRAVEVKDGAFVTEFGPYDRPLPLGAWEASATFELSRQSQRARRAWRAAGALAKVDALDHAERTLGLTVGTPEEITAQREAMLEHYRAVAAETTRLLGEVLAAYGSACRVLFKDPAKPGYDAKAHLAHLAAEGADATAAQTDLRFATATGHLKPDDYQGWAEGTWLPGWTTSVQADVAYRERTALAPVEAVAAARAIELHTILLSTLQGYSRALYDSAHLSVPASLTTNPSGVDLPSLPADARGRRAFERKKGELLQRLGGAP